MRINTNVSALAANRNLQNTASAVQKSMAKLSSGFRINSASDDAAGLAIANKFRSDIRALTQASRNAEQANSVLQIAEGGAANIERILERMGTSERALRATMTELGYETYGFDANGQRIVRLGDDDYLQSGYVFNLVFRHPAAA